MTSTTSPRYLSAIELAVEIRAELKRRFPKTKFSVRSSFYSMGSSVTVRWTDGPTDGYVSELLGRFEGKSFDGSDDSTHYHNITLPSGEVCSAGSYISTSRRASDAHIARVIAALALHYAKLPHETPTVDEYKKGGAYSPLGDETWQRMIGQALYNRRTTVEG